MPVVVRWARSADVDVSRLRPTPSERRRAEAFRFPADRESYLAAHALARTVAGTVAGEPPWGLRLAQRCTCGSVEHGAPYVAGHDDVSVSWSHTRGYVAAAGGGGGGAVGVDGGLDGGAGGGGVVDVGARGRREVGVDIERTDAVVPPEVLTSAELRLPVASRPLLWVLKEALVKVGHTTLDDLAAVDVSAAWTGAGRRGGEHAARVGPWTLRAEFVDGGHAVLGAAWGVEAG